MDASPAGWYDDPEQPGQKRWWDGSTWTDDRIPAEDTPPPPPAAPTPPPLTAPPEGAPTTVPPPPPTAAPPAYGAPAPPPPGTPAPAASKGSRKALWIVLAVVGVLVVLVVVGIAAITFLGDSATEVVEENLPQALEENFTAQGVDVTVAKVDCDSVSDDDGPFTTSCAITIDGLAEPLDATVTGRVDGNTVRVDDVTSEQTILTAELAATQAQPTIDAVDPTVSIISCTLPAPVVLVEDGLTFTCEIDTDETVTFEVQDNTLIIDDVS